MSYQVVDLPNISFSSGATVSPAVSNLDDAAFLTFFFSSDSTGSAYTVQVKQSASTAATGWAQLVVPGSTGSAMTPSAGSSQALMIEGGAFRQARVLATAAEGTSTKVIGVVKQILI